MMKQQTTLIFLIMAFLAAGCSEGNKPMADNRSAFLLKPMASANDFERTLKDGLINTYSSSNQQSLFAATDLEALASSDSASFTTTNLQEGGVDENDRVKTDGDLLYVLADNENRLKILDIDPVNGSAVKLSEITLSSASELTAENMYLYETDTSKDLITMSATYGCCWAGIWSIAPYWNNTSSEVSKVNVETPAAPEQGIQIEFDGSIISSRRVGDYLYFVNRFHPYIEGLGYFDPSGTMAETSKALIEAADIEAMLPTYKRSVDASRQSLVSVKDCYVPTEKAAKNATADIITLVAVDLRDMTVNDSVCYVGASETLYMSLESMYLATTRYEYDFGDDGSGGPITLIFAQPDTIETDIHKFNLEQGAITYTASGIVPGHLGWNVNRRPFRMSESNNDLRIVTHTGELADSNSPASLSVLRDDGSDELKIVGQIPNANRPEPLGKAGENIYAVRFVDDKAYVVTFQVVDPLYVLDIANPSDPFIAGELEIPGYSDYLHPLGNGLLLGLGKDAIPDPMSGDQFGAWYQGIKLALFDVSNPALPVELQTINIGGRGTHSEALNNHHAFTLLPATSSSPARLALGMDVHEHDAGVDPVSEPGRWAKWKYSGLHLFDIDTGVNPSMTARGIMKVEEFDPAGSTYQYPSVWGNDRSVIAGDSVFYVHGFGVYSSLYASPESFIGPN